MKEPSKHTESQIHLLNSFRAYLQVVVTAGQFSKTAKLSTLPGSKTANYCLSLAKSEDNSLARELAAPVLAILHEINKTAMQFYRPLYQKTIKDPKQREEHEKVLEQLDFALALIQRQFHTLIRFRCRSTKSADLLVDTVSPMLSGKEAANLIRRYQKEFPDDGCDDNGTLVDGGFPEMFARDTYQRVEELDRLVDDFPDHVKLAALQMHGWPMLARRHTNNKKRFKELATRLELGVNSPLDSTDRARFRPDTPLVRYLDPIVCKLVYVYEVLQYVEKGAAEDEKEMLRRWLWDSQTERPTDEEVEAITLLKGLPRLTKSTANEWAEKTVVPTILATDARDWKNCNELVLGRIAKQKGVKSRATFKSRLLSAVLATLRRLARPA
jgi:hypothetical protein